MVAYTGKIRTTIPAFVLEHTGKTARTYRQNTLYRLANPGISYIVALEHVRYILWNHRDNVSISIRGHDPTMDHSSSITCWSLFIVRRAHHHSFSEPYGQNVKVNKKRKQACDTQNTMNVEPARYRHPQ